MKNFTLRTIGRIAARGGETAVLLDEAYRPALRGLRGFSHLAVLWWFDKCDNEAARGTLTVDAPYRHSPAVLGTFATRSPARPNPLALTMAEIVRLDEARGVVSLGYLDADDGSPVLDLKPYTPSLDRVEHPRVPDWCTDWPGSLEASADFDWESVFSF